LSVYTFTTVGIKGSTMSAKLVICTWADAYAELITKNNKLLMTDIFNCRI
jgi:hypothetical protein